MAIQDYSAYHVIWFRWLSHKIISIAILTNIHDFWRRCNKVKYLPQYIKSPWWSMAAYRLNLYESSTLFPIRSSKHVFVINLLHIMDMPWGKFYLSVLKTVTGESKGFLCLFGHNSRIHCFWLKNQNLFSQNITFRVINYLNLVEKIIRNWNVDGVSVPIISKDIR